MNRFKVMEKIVEFINLEDNWNGYGAKKLSLGLIFKTMMIAEQIENEDCSILPTANDSIQIEYCPDDDKSYLEFEFFEDKISVVFIPNTILQYSEIQKTSFAGVIYYEKNDIIAAKINTIIKLFFDKKFDELINYLRSNTNEIKSR